ncbi:MAG: type VI secretion system ATPase TssH [Planctomycetia bacterium]|nr:type VI secretion system ATPase TssH [Planctomycetia bacterium]
MAQVNLKELVGKLNDTCRRTLEAAAGLCLSRTNYNVEIEHWLIKLLETPNTDLTSILRGFEVDSGRLTTDLTKCVDRLKTGNARPPALSANIVDLIREAWLIATIDFNEHAVRSGHLLCALLAHESLARQAATMSPLFDRISAESLRKSLPQLVAGSDEEGESAAASARSSESAAPGEPGRPKGPTKTPALDQYTIDLTGRAKSGTLDPVLGRDSEIRQIMDILCRRRQNNPILTGEAGVGKTAVAEGFALRVAAGDVPPALLNVSVRSLDLGLLQAGAGVKGEFENRLKSVISEAKSSATPIIMFIDEAHTLIGAGGQSGQGDAANLLKPALARGELRTIAATTWAEYKKYFEKDAALARRFQVVKVEEPTEKTAIEMMRGLVGTLEKHHKVRILSEAVEDAVRLSHRYISGRQLPDKAVSLLDTACARIGLSQSSTPPMIEDCRRRIEQTAVSIGILEREMSAGAKHDERVAELRTEKASLEKELAGLEDRWKKEKELVVKIHGMQRQLNGEPASPPPAGQPAPPPPAIPTGEERNRILADLAAAESELKVMQGHEPLVHVCVNPQAIAETVSSWTGIPLGRMVADEIKTVLHLKDLLEQSVVGQSHGLDLIAQSIRTSRANLTDPNRPIGVFLLAGTSGVGKTETAITLADLFYGGEQNMTTINMSEFKEEHKVSLLMGSPPGYVGYGEGGVLTEAVRRKPYSVVLLDEMEKAHPGVQDIFYQVFDKGQMKDGEGRDINFRNTIILMTSNAGTDLIKKLCADPETRPEPEAFAQAIFPELLKSFKPAFLGRLTVVPYYPLSDEIMRKIIQLKLGKIGRRVKEHYKAEFKCTPELIDSVAKRCTEVDTGARNVDHILSKTLLPEMSAEFLSRLAQGLPISSVEVSVGGDGNFVYKIA